MIWGNYLGDFMVRTTGTLQLRSFASYTPSEDYLYVYLMNKAEQAVLADLKIESDAFAGVEPFGQLTGKGPDDVDPVWNDNVRLAKKDLDGILLPPVSISVIKLKLK